MIMRRRVVVTGIGIVSPIGSGRPAFFDGLRTGRDGAGNVTRFNTEGFPVKRACEVKDVSLAPGEDPFLQFGKIAAREALSDGKIFPAEPDPERFGMVASSSKGGMTAFSGGRFGEFFPHRLSTDLAREFGIRGPVTCTVAACATGTISVIEGARLIERDEADTVLAGASDASVTPLMLAGYRRLGVYASEGMRPYDLDRDGFLVGEGAGFVVLEERGKALARKVPVYGEIMGWALGAETYRMVSFDSSGGALAGLLLATLKKSGLAPSDIDYLNTHGTSTREGDFYETAQIKKAFGRDAYRISLSSTKSMTGHMLGASGAVELIACLFSLNKQFIPPTIHIEKPDPACDLDYTANRGRSGTVRTALSFSMGFGGQMGAVLLARP